jgi:hypothetical protein
MANVAFVQITVWLDAEQSVEIVANSSATSQKGSVIDPCSDSLDFSRSATASGVSGADIRNLLDDIYTKLSGALKTSAQTIPICTRGAKIIACPKP